MPFRLRHLQHNFELSQGEFVIGRSAECQLALEDPLVSRRHAMLVVTPDSVTIKDLGSRNGVVVNGTRIDTSRILLDGDRVTIGSQEMTVVSWQAARIEDPNSMSRRRTGMQTLNSVAPVYAPDMQVAEAGKDLSRSFPVLAALADKALALGRSEDAERILASFMNEVLRGTQQGRPISNEFVDHAGHYGVKLAGATTKGSWVDYVIALYTAVRRPCPALVVDELHAVVRKTTSLDLHGFRAYVDLLHEEVPTFGPAERFLVQRIEGLERLASLR